VKRIVRLVLAGAVAAALGAGAALAQHGTAPAQHGTVTTEPAQHTEPPAHATDAASAGHAAPSIMQVNPGLMIWTVVTFVGLLVVLRFTAWGPLQKSLDAREKRIRDAVEGAERARAESEALLAKHQKMLDEAKDEARKIIEEGKNDGLRLKHDILQQARVEADENRVRALRELELAKDQAQKDLWEFATNLSTELAEKILKRALDSQDQKRLVEDVLQEYRTLAARSN
jgi:F-type H+-transporting ATPase subunit b